MSNEELVTLIQNGQHNLLEELYNQNSGMIRKICRRYANLCDHSFDDLCQQSFLELVEIANEWTPDRGASFITFLTLCLPRRLLRYCNNTGHIIRLPAHENALVNRYKKYVSQHEMEHGCKPSDESILQALQISQGQLEQLKLDIYLSSVSSLSELITDGMEDTDTTLADTVPDPVDHFEEADDRIIQGELAAKVWEAVELLKEDYQKVIKSYYADGMALEEIADDRHVTASYVASQKETALKYLRNRPRCRKLLEPFAEIYGMGIKGTGLHHFNNTWTSATEYAALKLLERDEK